MISYVTLCVRLGFRLPGTMTIPEQIERDRNPYFRALDQADAACKSGRIDVSAMETVIESLLAKQLTNIYELASGRPATQDDLA